jgi:GTPase-associated protein 1
MTVLQHYYTSFINKETGSAGFQVKAMSPGISSELQSLISRMIAYRIPPKLNEYKTSTHPIALRYYYLGPQECILLCSQSNGSDENGRPGNFFAHTLVMDPTIFTSVPPILYWQSNFWRTRDLDNRSQVAPLTDFDIEPSLDIENVWEFLAQGNRGKQFYKLMCAIVHYNKTQRRIVIIDKNEHVALWIAAVSCMLPPGCRPMLSFATYHHDPYQAPFMITGTTSDSSFHASPEEYISYFILNAETGRISDVEDSPYAETAMKAANAHLYDALLLPLFADYAQRFPKFTRIDEQLDLLALYANAITTSHSTTLTSNLLEAIRIAIPSFEKQRTYTQEDLKELAELEEILWRAYEAGHDAAIQQEHNRVAIVLKEHTEASDKLILKELKDIVKQLLSSRGTPEQATARLNILYQTFDRELPITIINQSTHLEPLLQLLEKANAQQLQHVWQCLGSYIVPGPVSQGLLRMSLRMVDHLLEQERFDEEGGLQYAMKQAMMERENEWLKLAIDIYAESPNRALKHFYYYLIHELPLDQRVPYRKLMQSKQGDLITYEIKSDVITAGPQRGLAMIERWKEHASNNHYPTTQLITRGVGQLKEICSPQQWHELAPKILESHILSALQPEIESELVQEVMRGLTLSESSPWNLELYKKYQGYPSLSDDTKLVIAAILAMSSGELNKSLSKQLHQRMKKLSLAMYQVETKRFVVEFFKHPITKEAHKLMISAFFLWDYHIYFWHYYWRTLIMMLASTSQAKRAVELLSFWFTMQPDVFLPQRYLLQDFFLEMPSMLYEIRQMSDFQKAVQALSTLATEQPWYPLIQDFFSERRNIFLAVSQAVGQNVMTQFQKFRSKERVEQQKQEREIQEPGIETQVSKLFDGKHTRILHQRHIQTLYSLHQREQFWRLYWQQFGKFLLSCESDYALDLFSFWFNDTSNLFEQVPYIAQDFFIALPQTLEMMQKERGFRDASQRIQGAALKRGSAWFTLIQPFFTQQVRR